MWSNELLRCAGHAQRTDDKRLPYEHCKQKRKANEEGETEAEIGSQLETRTIGGWREHQQTSDQCTGEVDWERTDKKSRINNEGHGPHPATEKGKE